MGIIKSKDLNAILYHLGIDQSIFKSFDITVLKNERFICRNQKEKLKEWNIYSAAQFQHANKLFSEIFVYIPEINMFSYMNLDKEHIMLICGMIWSPLDPVSEKFVNCKDQIYDFAFENGGSIQQGLEEFF